MKQIATILFSCLPEIRQIIKNVILRVVVRAVRCLCAIEGKAEIIYTVAPATALRVFELGS